MARLARVVVADVPHHVTQRGNRRQTTLFGDDDYRRYLALIGHWCQRCGVAVWAYCLMPNHVHLIVVPSSADGLRRGLGEAHRPPHQTRPKSEKRGKLDDESGMLSPDLEIYDPVAHHRFTRQILGNDATRIYVYFSPELVGLHWPASFPGGSTWDYKLVARSAYRAAFFEGHEDLGVTNHLSPDTTTVYDMSNTKNWPAGVWEDGYVMVFTGENLEDTTIQIRRIIASGSDRFTIDGSWTTPPDGNGRYVLVEKAKLNNANGSWYGGPAWSSLAPACTTARSLYNDYARDQSSAQAMIDSIRTALLAAFPANAFVKVPALFNEADRVSVLPNMVNLLNAGGTRYVADPFGPRNGETSNDDVFKSSVGGNWVDDWVLHTGDGDVHCGTNVRRTIPAEPSEYWYVHYWLGQ